MGLFGKSKAEKQREAALEARVAQEPPIRMVEGYPDLWTNRFPAIIRDVEVDGLVALYDSLDSTGRYLMLDEFGYLFHDDPASAGRFRQWESRLSPPQSPHEQLILAAIYNATGWHHRGEHLEDTNPQGQGAFEHYLGAALNLALAAGQGLGGDIVPFLTAQSSAFILSPQERDQVAGYWRAIDPFNRLGLLKLGFQLDERWTGDPTQQLAFAEHIAQHAPAGHDGLAAVAEIVTDRWEYLYRFDDLDEDEADAASLEQPRVQAFLELAYNKLFESDAAVDPRLEARHLNYFAWCFYWGGNSERAYDAFRKLGGRCFPKVWELRDDDGAEECYEAAREDAIDEVEFGAR